MRERLSHEIVASVLAGLTAFIGGTALHLPPWAIFISWAAVFALGGPSWANARRLWCTMPAGSTFALIIVFVDQHVGMAFGDSQIAQDAVLALIILVVNTALMYTGRIKMFSLIPGMFFGFASYFGTLFGGFGFKPGNIWAAWVCVVAMNALGPVFAYLSNRLMYPVLSPVPTSVVASAGPVHHDGRTTQAGTAQAE
ncbi:DUF1097 domain-containing protein [Streptomyces sp. NPDC058067]|uniref:DUF1097 domain-containing protein n=1 Tax=Streptomyces antnestii TaxID=2494256 RepID=A0A437PJD8_9ACTN|nr:DUF1097 domain-containing protein [Streptomyces sp. San01]RVU22391.1 DUF1097 domain-containing protein [Streptomyces sp. San01]